MDTLELTKEQAEALLPALHTEMAILSDCITEGSGLLWPNESNTSSIEGMVQMSFMGLKKQAEEERREIDEKVTRLVSIVETLTRIQLFVGKT